MAWTNNLIDNNRQDTNLKKSNLFLMIYDIELFNKKEMKLMNFTN